LLLVVAYASVVAGFQHGAVITVHYPSGYSRVKSAASRIGYHQDSVAGDTGSRLFSSPTATASAQILDKVMDVVAEQLGVDREKVQAESNFISDLGADSLDSVELVMAFEEKFGVSIPDEEASKIKTVQDAVDYISRAAPK